MGRSHEHLLLIWVLFQIFYSATPQSFIGVNYGSQADNLPPPSSTATLLASTSISKLRLYDPQPDLIAATANTNLSVLLGVQNSDVPTLASSAAAAASWAASNIPTSVTVSAISVGNELLSSSDPSLPSQLLPAMQNLLAALPAGSAIKVTTVHSMAVLSQSDPPSSGAFHPDIAATLDPVLAFLSQNGGPFMINPYPYFAYVSDPRPETLAFCLFQPNAGRVDAASGLTYMNMFDAQVDAIRAALDAKGYNDVEIVIAETGWPYNGDADETGATVANAQAYNGNLVAHLRSLVGTPRVPGASVDTYIFALYDEDLKPGPTSERSFGLYKVDLTPNYDTGLSKSVAQPSKGETPTGFCVTAAGVPGITQGGGTTVQPTSSCYIPVADDAPRRADMSTCQLLLLHLCVLLNLAFWVRQ